GTDGRHPWNDLPHDACGICFHHVHNPSMTTGWTDRIHGGRLLRLLAVLAALGLLAAACGDDDGGDGAAGAATAGGGETTAGSDGAGGGGALEGSLRLGYFANVTHAPAVIGEEAGIFAEALGDGVDL